MNNTYRVVQVHRDRYLVRNNGEEYYCVLTGSLRYRDEFPVVGDYTEITYYDDTDQMVDPEEASRIRIREMMADGTVIKESWGFCGKGRKTA